MSAKKKKEEQAVDVVINVFFVCLIQTLLFLYDQNEFTHPYCAMRSISLVAHSRATDAATKRKKETDEKAKKMCFMNERKKKEEKQTRCF